MKWAIGTLAAVLVLAGAVLLWQLSAMAHQRQRVEQARIDMQQLRVMRNIFAIVQLHDARITELEQRQHGRAADVCAGY